VLDFVRYELAPIRKYCSEHKVGIQALLMAADVSAHREFFSLPSDTTIIVGTVADTRPSPFATEAHKKREIFSGSALMYSFVKGKETMEDNVLESNKLVREVAQTRASSAILTYLGNLVDPKTGEMKPPAVALPRAPEYPFIIVSNVGMYRHVNKPRLTLRISSANVASSSIYSYSDGDVLEVFIAHGSTMDVKHRDAIIKSIDSYFKTLCGASRV